MNHTEEEVDLLSVFASWSTYERSMLVRTRSQRSGSFRYSDTGTRSLPHDLSIYEDKIIQQRRRRHTHDGSHN